jgi:hypothetical protein
VCGSEADRSGLPTRTATTEKRFIVRADEKLTAFLELERAIYHALKMPCSRTFRSSDPTPFSRSEVGPPLFLQQKRNRGKERGDRDDTIRRKRPTPKRGLGLNQDQHDTEYNDADFPPH